MGAGEARESEEWLREEAEDSVEEVFSRVEDFWGVVWFWTWKGRPGNGSVRCSKTGSRRAELDVLFAMR